jgi:hypothetical protein
MVSSIGVRGQCSRPAKAEIPVVGLGILLSDGHGDRGVNRIDESWAKERLQQRCEYFRREGVGQLTGQQDHRGENCAEISRLLAARSKSVLIHDRAIVPRSLVRPNAGSRRNVVPFNTKSKFEGLPKLGVRGDYEDASHLTLMIDGKRRCTKMALESAESLALDQSVVES